MTPEVARFSSHPHPFHVSIDCCTNPDCECADVTFHLTEKRADATTTAKPVALVVRIDPETWLERGTVSRPAAQAAIVDEFLRDYPDAEKEAFADLALKKRQTPRRIREYRIDPEKMKRASLIGFNQIASEHGSVASGGKSFSFHFVYEGREYLVEDMYCARPSCPCNEVHLMFFDYTPPEAPGGKNRAGESFVAVLSLGGELTIKDVSTCTRDQAAMIASAWQTEYPDAGTLLKWRDGKIKEIARRSLPEAGAQRGNAGRVANDWRMVQALSPATRPDRNDPCPCGSGRKFKRCCGRADAGRPAKNLPIPEFKGVSS